MGNLDDSKEKQVIEDMRKAYQDKISQIQDEIDYYKQMMLSSKTSILNYGERLHALYIKLTPKMNDEELDIQEKFITFLNKLHPFKTVTSMNGGEPERIMKVNSNEYAKLRHYLEKREIYLNKVLERVGLNIQEKLIKRRVR